MNEILSSVLGAEQGYWNDPIGGPTNFGIRQKTLDDLRKEFPEANLPVDVSSLTEAQARVIIYRRYLIAFRLHEMPKLLALPLAHGVVMAWDDIIKHLQENLGFQGEDIDGIVGSQTLRAIESLSLSSLYRLTADTIEGFLETRTNGYATSYRTRFAELAYA
jgi:lysozyme family protein